MLGKLPERLEWAGVSLVAAVEPGKLRVVAG